MRRILWLGTLAFLFFGFGIFLVTEIAFKLDPNFPKSFLTGIAGLEYLAGLIVSIEFFLELRDYLIIRRWKMRDTWGLIAEFVTVAGSLEEAIRLVDEEMNKGDCVPIPKHLRDERIEFLWEGKVETR